MKNLSLTAAILATTAIASPVFADGHLQIVEGDPLELTIQMNHRAYPVYKEDWPVEQKARELTNIHLKDVTVGANMRTDAENTGRTEALNLMLAGGTIPDIVGSSRIKDFVNQYGPEGAFIPLNDLIEEHAPNIKAYLDERPEIAAALKAADGQMYYIPYLPDGKYGRAYWIRTDWLNNLGLEVPQTVEEFENVLRAFKTQDPNGNGEADEIPLFFRQWPELIRMVTLWDGRAHGVRYLSRLPSRRRQDQPWLHRRRLPRRHQEPGTLVRRRLDRRGSLYPRFVGTRFPFVGEPWWCDP